MGSVHVIVNNGRADLAIGIQCNGLHAFLSRVSWRVEGVTVAGWHWPLEARHAWVYCRGGLTCPRICTSVESRPSMYLVFAGAGPPRERARRLLARIDCRVTSTPEAIGKLRPILQL